MNTKHTVFSLLLLVNAISVEASAPQTAHTVSKLTATVIKKSTATPSMIFISGILVGSAATYAGYKYHQAGYDTQKMKELVHADAKTLNSICKEYTDATRKQCHDWTNASTEKAQELSGIVIDYSTTIKETVTTTGRELTDSFNKFAEKLDTRMQNKKDKKPKDNQGGGDNDRRD